MRQSGSWCRGQSERTVAARLADLDHPDRWMAGALTSSSAFASFTNPPNIFTSSPPASASLTRWRLLVLRREAAVDSTLGTANEVCN